MATSFSWDLHLIPILLGTITWRGAGTPVLDLRGPSFDVEPASRVDFDNSTGTVIRCSANGNPMPDVWWETKDGTIVHDTPGIHHIRPDGSMVFSPFSAQQYRRDVHDATYRCVAANTAGKLGSRDVRVRAVLQDYKVTAYDAEFVIKGNVALLRCEITGSGKEYAYVTSWLRDDGLGIGISLNDNIGKYAVFPSGELLVRHVDDADSKRKYRCQIYNKISQETRLSDQWARIIITEPHGFVPPKIIHWRREAHAEEGENVWLPCVGHGYPVPRVQWYRQEAGLMTPVGQGLRVTEMDGMLVIHRANMQDSGKYACIVNNTKGEEQVHSTLMIKGALRAAVSPPEKIVTVGIPLLLRCDVSGSPIHYLEWKKNLRSLIPDNRVRQQSNNVLEITSVRLGDEGVYQCFVYNSEESAQGSSTVLIQADPPVIESHFKEQTVPPGNTVSLRCVAKGHPLPKITWTADGESIPPSSRLRLGDFVTQDGSIVHSFLNISSVEVTDGREYACHADSDFGRVSHQSRLNVPSPPIGRSPENRTALVGSTAEFRCPVAGYPLTHFSWEKDGESLPNSHRHEVRPDGKMIIHYVEKMTDDGSYWCTASDPRRVSARGRVDVQVVAGPVVDPFSFPDNLREGRRTTVNCLVSAGDPPIAFRWLKDGETIPPTGLDITVDYLNQFTSSIFFERVGQKHNGNYTCIATNPYASANHTAQMLIQIPPRWILEPKDAEVVRGSSIRVDCQADGFPKPIIRWKQRTSSANAPETFHTIMSSARMQVLENGSLLVLEVGPSDEGSFLCQAFNGIGAGLSKMMTITVNVPAYFKTKFISQKVKKGDPVNLNCKAQGDTPLSVTWYKDGVIIGNSSIPRYTKRQYEHHDGLTSQITAHSATRDDSAVFSCRASNLYGHDDSTIELVVQEPPDNPAQPEVVHISSRTVHVRWSVPFNGNSPITRFLVVTENEKNPDTSIKTVEVSGTQTDATIRGLSPRTTYNIHLLAENAIGRGPPSQYLSVTTDDEVPRTPPRQVKVAPTASNSLKVTWMAPEGLDQGTASITGYYVGYRAVTSGDKYLFKTLKVRDSFKTESLLTNLQSSTQYSVVVQAFNDKGPGPQSDEVLATTFNFDPPKSPAVRIIKKTTNSVQIEWDSAGSVDGFLVYIREKQDEWKEATLSREIRSYTFEGLKCGTEYQIYLIPFSNEGKGQTSEVITVRTEGKAPGEPKKDHFLQVNSTSATIFLSAWDDGGCAISHYFLRYRSHHHKNWTEITLPSRPKAYITALNPGHWYKIRAGATNSAGLKEVEFDIQTRRIDIGDARPPQTSVIAESSYMELQRRVAVITSAVCSAVVLVVILIAACTVLTRRRRHRPEQPDHADRRSTGEVQKSESVALSAWEKRTPRGEGRSSHCRESLYLPCPYATARLSHFSVDGDTDSGVPHSMTIDSANEHSYDVPIQVLSKLH